MDIKTLGYFLQVCKAKSYSQAAKESYISPQGLSQAMRLLEQELSAPLFIKTENGKELTKYGECVYKYAVQCVEGYKVLKMQISDLSKQKKERIRIGFSYGTIGSLGLKHLLDFQTKQPYIELIYEDCTDYICEKKLKEGLLDFAITVAPYDNKYFHTTQLKREQFHWWIHRHNPLSKKESINFIDLKDQKIMMVNKEFKSYRLLYENCRKYGFIPNVVFTTAEMGLLRQLVSENQGIALTVEHEINIKTDQRIVTSIPQENMYWSYGISYCKNHLLRECEKLYLNDILALTKNGGL